MCFRGGGNRGEARGIVREADLLAAKQLGSEAAKVVDAKTPRCKEAKSVTETKVVKTISSKQKQKLSEW